MSIDKKITVMHIIGALRIGGAERQLVALAPQFDPEKFRIIIATMQPVGTLDGMLDGTHVEHIELNYRTRYFPAAIWRLRKILKREKVDVLHTHMYGASHLGRIAGVLASVPVMVTTDHGHDPWKKRHHISFEKYMLRYTAMRLAVSEDVAKTLKSREGVPDEKLMVMPNGVDVERFQVDPSARRKVRDEFGFTDDIMVIGAIGRLVEPKALHVLIESMKQVSAANPDSRLLIVGEGELRESLERQVNELNLSDKVIFTGPRTDIPEILAALDIYTLPSKREGLPVALLEAMAAGKPIVTTKVGGIPEVITDEKEGLLIEPENSKALADAILRLMDDKDLGTEMGKRAVDKVTAEYSISATARRLEDLYRFLLDKARGKQ